MIDTPSPPGRCGRICSYLVIATLPRPDVCQLPKQMIHAEPATLYAEPYKYLRLV